MPRTSQTSPDFYLLQMSVVVALRDYRDRQSLSSELNANGFRDGLHFGLWRASHFFVAEAMMSLWEAELVACGVCGGKCPRRSIRKIIDLKLEVRRTVPDPHFKNQWVALRLFIEMILCMCRWSVLTL